MVACQKTETIKSGFDEQKDAKLITALKTAYGLTSFNIEPSKSQNDLILNSLSKSLIFSKFESKIDKKTIRLFENSQEGVVVAMMKFNDSPDKYYSVKGTFIKGSFLVSTESLLGRKIVDKNNGQIIITNNDQATLITFTNGIQNYSQLGYADAEMKIIQVKDCQGRHGGTGFCQREPYQNPFFN